VLRSASQDQLLDIRKEDVAMKRLTRYLGLVLVFALVGAGGAGAQATNINQATLAEANQKTAEVSTEELKRILADRSAVVLDARPYMEFAMSHIPGAQNVAPKPGVSMSMYVSDVAEVGRLVGGDKSKAIVLYCNGPFCGKSKRLSEELVGAGFTNVRRYQLGIPVWRALVGITTIELPAIQHVVAYDRTAVFLDARSLEEFRAGSLPGARSIPQGALEPGKDKGEIRKAKDDGRLPMEDHNTRIIIFGRDAGQARILAEAVAQEAFHNAAYFVGTYDALRSAVK
jgi:rhodanese-related sulfurtransferase